MLSTYSVSKLPVFRPLLAIGAAMLLASCANFATSAAPTATPPAPVAAPDWHDTTLSVDARSDLLVKAMTEDEKLQLVFGAFGSMKPDAVPPYAPPPEARMGSAGYVAGIPRLGIPPQWITDAGQGVATQRESSEPYRQRTALPSGLAAAATFSPVLAERAGAMIGFEARASGFDVMLAGGADLLREPRNGRNFEYAGEDPLLAGKIVGAEIAGIQSNHIISTTKHWALNDQETGRMVLSADMPEAAARMSDFLAFEIAIEKDKPGSVMCSYNRVDAVYACQNRHLLEGVLKGDWGYPGYVMSDWGAVHSTVESALAGLDQESGSVFDDKPYFGAALKQAVDEGTVPMSRLDDMARRIVHSMFATGLMDHPVHVKPIDFTADKAVAEAEEQEAAVLLRNRDGILPLARAAKRVLVIGGHADKGVLSGGGSSTVFPLGGNAVPGLGPKSFPGPIVYLPSSPLDAIKARLPSASVTYLDGGDIKVAARAAKSADIVIVFATQWSAESEDNAMALDGDQNALIAAVGEANRHTVVVLETGGPVLMPWLDETAAVLEAWYPGSGGGEAIAKVLFGEVDAAGRLPATFPATLAQLPHPQLPGADVKPGTPFDVDYSEGAAVGYKWFEKNDLKPLFPFGFGLSYTSFSYSDLAAKLEGGKLHLSFKVTNTGSRMGEDVPQLYAGPKDGGWEAPRRLVGFARVDLLPGASSEISLVVDPRLLAVYDTAAQGWKQAAGTYNVTLGSSSAAAEQSLAVDLPAAQWTVGAK